MSRTAYLLLTLLFGAIFALPPFSLDTALPATPDTADDLGADTGAVQLSIASYTLGAAIGQLIIGAYSDRYGRRNVLICALVLFVIASIGCALAGSVETLIALRFVQGAATAGGRVLPRAMVRDLYDREDAARLLSYMMVIGGMAPVLAPLVGGYLSAAFGWRSTFTFIAGYGLFLLVLCALCLRETLPPERRVRLHPKTTASNLWMLLRHPVFIAYVACLGALSGGLFAFLSASSTVLIRTMDRSPQDYGHDLAIVMVGGIAFNYLAGRLVGPLGLDRMLGLGALLAALSGLAMAGLAWAGIVAVWAIVGPMFVYMLAYSFVVSAASAGGLSPFPQFAGTAASFMGFLQIAAAAVVTALLGLVDDGTAIPMTSAIGIMGVLLLLAYLFLVRRLPPARGG